MQMTQSHKPFKKINYYPLNNGFVDVYLHKNETQEVDEEGNIQYVAEEVHFQIDVKTTKEMIEENFEFYWENEGEGVANEATTEPTEIELLQQENKLLKGQVLANADVLEFQEEVIFELIMKVYD